MFAKGPEFGMWVSFHLRNIALKFFPLGCSSFSRYYVCKQPSVFQAASFGDLLLNKKQKETFCFAKGSSDYNTIFSHFCFVDNAPNGADSNLRTKVSFVFCLTIDLQKMPFGKLRVVCIRYISKMKSNPAKKKTLEQCFSGETKPTCKNSGPFADIFFSPKLHSPLQIIGTPLE